MISTDSATVTADSTLTADGLDPAPLVVTPGFMILGEVRAWQV